MISTIQSGVGPSPPTSFQATPHWWFGGTCSESPTGRKLRLWLGKRSGGLDWRFGGSGVFSDDPSTRTRRYQIPNPIQTTNWGLLDLFVWVSQGFKSRLADPRNCLPDFEQDPRFAPLQQRWYTHLMVGTEAVTQANGAPWATVRWWLVQVSQGLVV